MSAVHTFVTVTTCAGMNGELATDRLSWKFFLELLKRVKILEFVMATVGTVARQRSLMLLVDFRWVGRRAMAMLAVLLP